MKMLEHRTCMYYLSRQQEKKMQTNPLKYYEIDESFRPSTVFPCVSVALVSTYHCLRMT